jgi:hypothetical protein
MPTLMGKYAKALLKSQERKYTDFGLMIADCGNFDVKIINV